MQCQPRNNGELPYATGKNTIYRIVKDGNDWVDWLMGLPPGWTDIDTDMELPDYYPNWFDIEPPIPRVAQNIPHRIPRLKLDGNGVVPQQVYPMLAAIEQIERQRRTPTLCPGAGTSQLADALQRRGY